MKKAWVLLCLAACGPLVQDENVPQAKHHAEIALLEDETPMKISDEAYGRS
ncbi:MAG: hypothetical protein Q8N23_18215 [Archangium sp.]|nr:hypothetical protein [Archangium sp.]MDP3154619.1 hypothetical protein [Archangium sp.]MDP3574369.1 hypothetical protein [Archangium sp.]